MKDKRIGELQNEVDEMEKENHSQKFADTRE